MGEDVRGRADLHQPARVEHRRTVAGRGDDAHVVGDQKHRHAALAREALQERRDLRLKRRVQRGGGFVGDDQLRVAGQSQCDDDALAHPAREFVRVGGQQALRIGKPRLGEKPQGVRAGLRAGDAFERSDRLIQLRPDRHQGIQARERVLKDESDPAAAHGPHFALREAVEPSAAQRHGARAPDDPLGEEPAQGRPRHRLPGAGFAHEPHDFARADRERQVGEKRRARRILGPDREV